jgi:hypothetical protein
MLFTPLLSDDARQRGVGMAQPTFVMPPARKEALEAAYRWLDNAIRYEADGRAARLVDPALTRAGALETHAFTLPAVSRREE